MASGALPGGAGFKFFMHAAEPEDLLLGSDGPVYLAQVMLTAPSGECSIVVKTVSSTQSARDFADTIIGALSAYGPRKL